MEIEYDQLCTEDDLAELGLGEQKPPSAELLDTSHVPPVVPKAQMPSKAAHAKASGQKKPSKKFSRQCKVCQLWHEPVSMATSRLFCHFCKNRVDNISRIARAQGKEQWWTQIRSNDVQLQQVVNSYQQRVGDITANGGKKGSRAATMTYLESCVASTALIIETAGQFMTRRQYLHWAQSIEGNRMSED